MARQRRPPKLPPVAPPRTKRCAPNPGRDAHCHYVVAGLLAFTQQPLRRTSGHRTRPVEHHTRGEICLARQLACVDCARTLRSDYQ